MRPAMIVLFLAVAWYATAAAHAAPSPLQGWRVAGEAEMRFLGFKVYQIRLWRPTAEDAETGRFALELEYARSFRGADIVKRTLAEMRGQGFDDKARLARWGAALSRILPDVKRGDRLIGIAVPGVEARFHTPDRLLGRVADPAFVDAFFAIWLSERTSAPHVRRQLLAARP